MSQPVPTAYDTVVYPGFAYVQTHPDHIATLARLCGLDPAPIGTSRVLEVGCGDAANLIPMAAALPQASFRGFDFAAGSIERGRALANELGLTNLALEHRDICELPDRLGEFDYIIAHGFYSWVPQPARNKLMAICRASLAPQGVAFVSYNTFPGGHIRRMIREMMLFHVERAPDPQTKTTQARALLSFLSKLNAGEDEYELILKKELERILKYGAAHLYHDDLGSIFDCFYLHEFVGHAAEHDLQFMADLNSTFVHIGGLDAETSRALSELEADPIRREQYLDFACCRRFRQTLLCHAGLPVGRQLVPGRLEGLLISSGAKPVSEEVNLNSDREEEFRGARNASLKTDHPVMKAAMVTLSSVWPERLPLEDLRARIAALLDVTLDSVPADLLAQGVIAAFTMRILDFHVYSPRLTRLPGEHPQTSRLVRLQAEKGEVLTNLLHQSVKVEGAGPRLLCLLDGRRNREQLAADLPASPDEIDAALAQFARLALLEA
jgi:methyltransferase-like protein/2-polyprenyl-3-methyl-5-hydroxy-6-metoxy-1,4-benzoquinol methylase